MKISARNVPKFLVEAQSKISEFCRDYVLIVNHEGNTYWLYSTDYAAKGLCEFVGGAMSEDFLAELAEDELENKDEE